MISAETSSFKQDNIVVVAKKYKCDQCDRTYNHLRSFKEHVAIHKGDPTISQCSICENTFASKEGKRKHEVICKQKRIQQHPCRVCKEVYNDIWILNKHYKKAHLQKFNGCKTCGYVGLSLNELKKHSLIHIDTKEHKCEKCGRTYKRIEDLARHMNSHTETYKCEICGRCLECSSSLLRHINTHRKVYPYKCLDCEEAFEDKSLLDKHVKEVHPGYLPNECKQCGMRFPTLHTYAYHRDKQHSEHKKYQCMVCGFRMFSSSEYHLHIKIHKNVNAEEKLHCFYCESIDFADIYSLRKHITEFHDDQIFRTVTTSSANLSIYKCSKCTYQGILTDLSKHFKKHNEGLLKCKYCFVELVSVNEREKHEKKHLDKKGNVRYNCCFCTAKFENREKYADHFEKNHNTSQQHSCKYCQRRFTSLGNCARHILRIHEEHLVTIENDEVTQLERLQIELHGFEMELVSSLERDEKGRLAFECPKCKNKFYGFANMKYHYDYYADYKSGKTCKANNQKHKPHTNKEQEEVLEEENSDSETESDEQSEIDESCAEPSDSIEELLDQPIWDTSTSEPEVETTCLPLTVAVYQHFAKNEDESCLIVWCTKLESDLTSLLLLKTNRLFICVVGSKHLAISKNISKSHLGLEITSANVNIGNNNSKLAIIYGFNQTLNETAYNSIAQLEKKIMKASNCESVIHFIRKSHYDTSQSENEINSKLVICNHTDDNSC